MNVGVVLVAAGAGRRLGSAVPKVFVEVAGVPLLAHALDNALACRDVAHVVVVAPPTELAQARGLVAERADRTSVTVVAGGASRTESVAHGLAALPDDVGIVLVHDAARALTPADQFTAVVAAVRHGHGAVVPGLPVRDTIKQVDAEGHVVATPPRASLRAVQTPQGFLRETLVHAHECHQRSGPADGAEPTDDAALVEAVGGTVTVVAGHPRAVKVTTPDDLDLLQWWLTRDRP